MESSEKPQDNSFLGSVHVSTSNLMSYSLVTMAGMLAFYFAFQAGMLTGYAYLYEKFLATYNGWPVGKVVPFLLLGVVTVFNVWSFKIVCVFVAYFLSFIEAGAQVEKTAGLAAESGLYAKMRAVYGRAGQHENLYFWTCVFFLFNTLFWVVLALWPLLR